MSVFHRNPTRIMARAVRLAVPAGVAAGLLIAWAGGPVAAAGSAGPAGAGRVAAAAGTAPAGRPLLPASGPIILNLPAPLATAQCQARFAVSCYTPLQLRAAYDLAPLYRRGITGRGRTIVIVTPFGSPTIRHDLRVFDARFGFPNPRIKIIRFGTIPPYNPKDPTRVDWAAGTTIQAEYAHAVAPAAKIVIAETPVSENEGVSGFPQLMRAERSLIRSGTGDVFLQIFGTAENTFPGFGRHDFASLLRLRYAFTAAAAHHVTVLDSAGDAGATGAQSNGSTLFPYRVVTWPASDPLVTAVGGAQLYLNAGGARLQPDTAWIDGQGAGGGGVSAVFARPRYQDGVRGLVGGRRGTPDITMSASVNGGCWVYLSFAGTGGTGWSIFDGTDESVSMFSGIVALADQQAGRRLGLINRALYLLGSADRPARTGIVDITQGNNSFAGVTGYNAAGGYDLATGWGTIDAARFVPALAGLAWLTDRSGHRGPAA